MAYSINPSAFGSMFAVPSQVVDNYIKLAGPAQLKSLLWVLRHVSDGINVKRMSEDIGYSEADIRDALVFWCEVGILVSDGKTVKPLPEPEKNEETKVIARTLPEIQAVRPSYEQIIVRCKESPDINDMFNDIQKIIGKTIGYDSQSVLIMMHDQYGLPPEVIYMLVDYCASVGKRNFSYISKVGKDWGEKEIDTIDKAEAVINELKACNGLWKEFAAMAGLQNPKPSSAQSAFLRTWSVDMKFNVEMIYLAYEEMLDHSSRISFAYMNKILDGWHNKGIKTPSDVEKDKQAFRKSKGKVTAKSDAHDSSFDMDEFKRRADKLPVYKKEG